MTLDLSSSLRIFLPWCCLIEEKKIVTDPSIILLKKFPYFWIFSAEFKSNNLSYFAPSLRILFSVLIIVFPPYLQYIAFSLIPTPSSSIATIFFIVTSPGRRRNINIWFTKLNKCPWHVRKFYCNLFLRHRFLLFNSAIFFFYLVYVKLDQDLFSPYEINECERKSWWD